MPRCILVQTPKPSQYWAGNPLPREDAVRRVEERMNPRAEPLGDVGGVLEGLQLLLLRKARLGDAFALNTCCYSRPWIEMMWS
jgi:hypothetical protein